MIYSNLEKFIFEFNMPMLFLCLCYSLQQFDSLCIIGQWISTSFVPVPSLSDGVTFSHMCLPPFEKRTQLGVHTRINSEGILEVIGLIQGRRNFRDNYGDEFIV